MARERRSVTEGVNVMRCVGGEVVDRRIATAELGFRRNRE